MKENAYKQAGVDIDAAAQLIENIKPHIKKTARSGVMSGIGGFGALFDLKATGFKDPVLVSSTDGVGTKIKLAIDLNRHDTIGIDAVAMCVNDVVVQGAEPLFFLDYFATGKLDIAVAEAVIASVAEGCEIAGCALIGGETAEMPGLYAPGDYDLAGFTVGAVERDQVIGGETITPGDIVFGLASNGLHSNGFSLVRHLVKTTGQSFDGKPPFEGTLSLGELCLMPTRIYVRSVLAALKIKNDAGKPAIKGMAHITGGGLIENIPRILPENACAQLDAKTWRLPNIFRWLSEIGDVRPQDMVNTLNCGLGLVFVCDPAHAGALKTCFETQGETVYQIGQITARQGVSAPAIRIENLEDAWRKQS
jgi:phosphoribosylformylglycinamidine cyclo-ligase